MRKIINNKMYDTETATMIGEYWNRCGEGDSLCTPEQLYVKSTGEYFLYVCGGPYIIPYTVNEAKDWIGKHLDADEYVALFGEVEE